LGLEVYNNDNHNPNTGTMFIVLSSWQSHCESSPGSRDKYSNGVKYLPTFGPSYPDSLVHC